MTHFQLWNPGLLLLPMDCWTLLESGLRLQLWSRGNHLLIILAHATTEPLCRAFGVGAWSVLIGGHRFINNPRSMYSFVHRVRIASDPASTGLSSLDIISCPCSFFNCGAGFCVIYKTIFGTWNTRFGILCALSKTCRVHILHRVHILQSINTGTKTRHKYYNIIGAGCCAVICRFAALSTNQIST